MNGRTMSITIRLPTQRWRRIRSVLVVGVVLSACARDASSGESETKPEAPAAPAAAVVPDSVRARVAARTLVLMRAELRDSVQAILTIADGSVETHPVNPATLCSYDCGTWERDSFDLDSRGSRVTLAAGLAAIAQARTATLSRMQDACVRAAAVLPDTIAALTPTLRPAGEELCAIYLHLTGSPPPAERVERFFAQRRASEIEEVSKFLEERIGELSGPLSADRERAVMYLGRLADQMTGDDGAVGMRVRARATASAEWRNTSVEQRNITADMREELAAREAISRMETQFRANQVVSDRIRAEKAARTPYQREEAWRSVCSATVAAGLISRADATIRGCP
jgi:hypothetical protein